MLAERIWLADFKQDAKACRGNSTVNKLLEFILKGESDVGRQNKIPRDADLPSTVILPCWWLITSPFEPNGPDIHIPHFFCWWKNLIFGMPFVGFKIPLCCGECEGREFHFSADMLKACIKGWALYPSKVAGRHLWLTDPTSLTHARFTRLETLCLCMLLPVAEDQQTLA